MYHSLLKLFILCFCMLNGVLTNDEPISLSGSSHLNEHKYSMVSDHVSNESEKLNSGLKNVVQEHSKSSSVSKETSEEQSTPKSDKEHFSKTKLEDEHKKREIQANTSPASIGRQFPYHQPLLFQQPTGIDAIRRQFSGGIGTDILMMGLISLPILGLLARGSASFGNILGLGASSSSSKKSRSKRSLKEKAAHAVEYAKNLWNVMEQLEEVFEKYDFYQAECRLRVVCEAHQKDKKMGLWGNTIRDLMRQQKELEGRELFPVSRFLFSNYAEAAEAGTRNEDCSQLYTGCPRHLPFLTDKDDDFENEIENEM